MKKLFYPIITLLLVVAFSSCDKINELADVDIPLEVTSGDIDLNTSSTAKQADFSFDQTVTVDIFQGELADYKKYLSKIKKFKVEKLTVKVVKLNPSEGVAFVTPTKAKLIGASGNTVEIDLSGEAITVGKEFVFQGGDMDAVNSILNEKKNFQYKLVGGFNKEADATLQITIKGKVTVNVLD
jgi:hypothetical protein